MRRPTAPLCAAALMTTGIFVASGQDRSKPANQSSEVQQNSTTRTADRTENTSADTVIGKVESYEAGKSLKVSAPGKIINTKAYSLDSKDWTYHVTPNLNTGDWVKVTETTDPNGHKTLTVQRSNRKSES
jgi:ribosomal protein S17